MASIMLEWSIDSQCVTSRSSSSSITSARTSFTSFLFTTVPMVTLFTLAFKLIRVLDLTSSQDFRKVWFVSHARTRRIAARIEHRFRLVCHVGVRAELLLESSRRYSCIASAPFEHNIFLVCQALKQLYNSYRACACEVRKAISLM